MHLIPRADPNCLKCGAIPACPSCLTGEICQISGQKCDQCPVASCIPAPSNGAPPQSNPGTIAGTVVGVLALVGVAVGLFIFYRKRKAAAAARQDEPKPVPDVPASASDVLSRPDPIEKRISYANNLTLVAAAATTNNDFNYPTSQYIQDQNPFADQASINTASERSQNVIPIAYIPPPSPTRNANRDSDLSSTPSRPQRDPSMNLHLGNSNAQDNARSSLLPPKSPRYEPSQRSGVSGVSSRASFMSSASSAIDFLNDAPQIITPVHGHVRQVVGVGRAEVVQLPSSPSTPGGLHPRMQRSTNAGPSPLARAAFTSGDSLNAVDDKSSIDPFADSHSRHDSQASFAHSFSSTSTFGSPRNHNSAAGDSGAEWSPAKPSFNFAGARPDSVGSAITADISSAKVVTLGRQSSVLHRTLADYATPAATPATSNFKHLTAMTESSEFSFSRGSLASTNRISTTDSILEAFPFVPPEAGTHGQLPPSPLSPSHPGLAASNSKGVGNQTFPTNPSRHTLGLSTVSSASSSALDGYTFQFSSGDLSLMPPLPSAALTDRGSTSGVSMSSGFGASDGSIADAGSVLFTPTESEFTPTAKSFPRAAAAPPPPSSFSRPALANEGAMRDSHASLDTLALSRELEAFPLTFDAPTPVPDSPRVTATLPRADTFGNGSAGKNRK